MPDYDKRQELAHSFGFSFLQFGCEEDFGSVNGIKYYNQEMIHCLEEIHGNGWWNKFQSQLDSINVSNSK